MLDSMNVKFSASAAYTYLIFGTIDVDASDGRRPE